MDEGKIYSGTYAELTSQDIINWCRPLLETNSYYLRASDGKIVCKTFPAWNTPWHHVRHAIGLNCFLWHQLMFLNIFPRIPNGNKWVPSDCHNCFKVVVRPQSLVGLHALLNLQKQLDYPSKCGAEVRPTVHGLYGGYFYNWSLEEGKEKWKLVRDAVNKTSHLGPETPVILKRACTEYEMRIPNSDKWQVYDDQIKAEAVIKNLIHQELDYPKQSDHQLIAVHKMWIEWAFQSGDPTYKEFTGDQPLYRPYVTYEHLIEKEAKKKAPKQKAKK